MQEGQRSPAMTVTDGGPGQLASPQRPIVTRDPVAGYRLQVPGPGDVSVEDMTALHAPTIDADNRSPSDRAVPAESPAGHTPNNANAKNSICRRAISEGLTLRLLTGDMTGDATRHGPPSPRE